MFTNHEKADLLESGANEIERLGWWKSGMEQGNGQVCAALSMQVNNFPLKEATMRSLAYFLDLRFTVFTLFDDVYKWNDRQESGDVVVRAMRDCASALRRNAS